MAAVKLFPVPLGCPRVRREFEEILAGIEAAGVEITFSPEEADVALMSSCTFITPAFLESKEYMEWLLNFENLKKVFVVGCVVRRAYEELKDYYYDEWISGRLRFIDVAPVDEVVKSVLNEQELLLDKPSSTMTIHRFSLDPLTAHVRIAEGCSNRCSYCIIPHLRGNVVFRKADEILKDVELRLNEGVREINLVAQDTTAWRGEKGGQDIVWLLNKLEDEFSNFVEDKVWFRVLYMYPAKVNDELIDFLLKSKLFVPYFDIPFQHTNSRILKEMKRRYSRDDVFELVSRIRRTASAHGKRAFLRSAFIVGWPTETEEDFKKFLEDLKLLKLDRAGFFYYDPDPWAESFKLGDLEIEVKLERQRKAYAVQEWLMAQVNEKFVGEDGEVLLVAYDTDNDCFLARGWFEPDDTEEYIIVEADDSEYEIGDFVVGRFDKIDESGRLVMVV